jgi:protein gp37
MNYTAIQYIDFSWNSISGCSNQLECREYCWARKMALRQAGRNGYDTKEPFKPTFHPDRLEQPLRKKKPSRIAVNFMGDMFGEGVPDEWVNKTFAMMALCPQHTFLVLTKRPDRMAKYLAEAIQLRNCWLGTSISNQATASERLPQLLNCPGNLWVSIEPMMGPCKLHMTHAVMQRLRWVVLGGGPTPVHPDWVRSVKDQCEAAGVPFFFKQWGEWMPISHCPKSSENLSHCIGWELSHVSSMKRYGYLTTGCGEDEKRIFNGRLFETQHIGPQLDTVVRVGKKAAGDMLDGKQYHELPSV